MRREVGEERWRELLAEIRAGRKVKGAPPVKRKPSGVNERSRPA